MAHLQSCYSGLPYIIMIDYDGIKRKRKDNSPRIMISLDNHLREIIPVSIDKDNLEILNKNSQIPRFRICKKWIIKNLNILLKRWNNEIDDKTMVLNLKRIED